jgi:hypothetical protein
MATHEEADQARKLEAESLRRAGAHAVGVEPVTDSDTSYAVVAYFERNPESALPGHLELQSRGRKIRVPLKRKIRERFALE